MNKLKKYTCSAAPDEGGALVITFDDRFPASRFVVETCVHFGRPISGRVTIEWDGVSDAYYIEIPKEIFPECDASLDEWFERKEAFFSWGKVEVGHVE